MPKRYTTPNNTSEKFTGKELDSSLNLYYFGKRYYDPALGRWHSVDPLSDKYPSLSPYNYTLNNPVNFYDPDGNCPMPTLFCAGMQEGFANSLAGSWQGIKSFATNPAGTIKGIGRAIYNYEQTFAAIKAGVGQRVDMATSGNPFKTGQVAGEGVALVGGVALTKGVGKLAKGAGKMSKMVKVNSFTRALKASDLGIKGTLNQLKGTFSVTDNVANVRIDMINAEITNPFSVIKNLTNTAREVGASKLRIEGVIAYPKLYNTLKKRYDLVTIDKKEIIEINIE